MQRFDEWQLPDGETHLQEWMTKVNKRFNGRLTYQFNKYEIARGFAIPGRSVAVDVGAHVGLWSWVMSHDYHTVHAFEPMDEHITCFRENLQDRNNVHLHKFALGSKNGLVTMRCRTMGSTGDTGIDVVGVTCKMQTLDSFRLHGVNLIKVDCEGYELHVLKGAMNTLRRCKPCIIVEQKPGLAQRYGLQERGAVEYLLSLGAILRAEISGDFILSW